MDTMKKLLIIGSSSLIGIGLFTGGYFVAKRLYKKKINISGTLMCDTVSDEEQYLHLELKKPIVDILKHNNIVLNVEERKIKV